MKILSAKAKNRKEATNQLKRWFKMNPNRRVIKIELINGISTITRAEIIK